MAFSLHATIGPNPATGLVSGQVCNIYRASRFASLPATNGTLAIGRGALPTQIIPGGGNASGGTTVAVTLTVTLGNFLVAVVSCSGGVTGIASALGNVWTAMPVTGGSAHYAAWTAPVTVGGSETVTVSCGSGNNELQVSQFTAPTPPTLDVFHSAHGTSTAPNSGATAAPAGVTELVMGLIATSVYPVVSSATFSPALVAPAYTDYSVTGAAVGQGVGSLATASAETFSSTITSATWSCWCLTIAEGVQPDYGPINTDTAVDFYVGGVEATVNTWENFYVSYYDPADTSNGGTWNTYWLDVAASTIALPNSTNATIPIAPADSLAATVAALGYTIDSGVLTTATSTITLPASGSILQLPSWSTLELDIYARGDTAAAVTKVLIYFNGQNAYNFHDWQFTYGGATGISAGVSGDTSSHVGYIPGNTAPAGAFGVIRIVIPGYADASHDKSLTVVGATTIGTSYTVANEASFTGAAFWYPTQPAAIASVSLTPLSGNFVAGSRFVLRVR